jgi:hypothetical protein
MNLSRNIEIKNDIAIDNCSGNFFRRHSIECVVSLVRVSINISDIGIVFISIPSWNLYRWRGANTGIRGVKADTPSGEYTPWWVLMVLSLL